MSVKSYRLGQWLLLRCTARAEWEKLKAESESLKGSKRADIYSTGVRI
jgi:hypothetical protein